MTIEIILAAAYVNIVVTRGVIFDGVRYRIPTILLRCLMCFSIYAAIIVMVMNSLPQQYIETSKIVVRAFALAGAVYAVSLFYELIDTATAGIGQQAALMEIQTKIAEAELFNAGASTMRAYEDIE